MDIKEIEKINFTIASKSEIKNNDISNNITPIKYPSSEKRIKDLLIKEEK